MKRIYSLLTLAFSLPMAFAITTTTPGASVFTSDPGIGLPFDNVLSFNGSSAVYLGDGWIITARHVGSPTNVNINNSSFLINSALTTNIPAAIPGTDNPDLRLFRLNSLPSLPALTIGGLSFSDNVQLVGNGGPGPQNGASNIIAGDNFLASIGANNTISAFTLSNNPTGSVLDGAQAVGGDSGGAAFTLVNGQWQLGGILHAVATDVTLTSPRIPDGFTADVTLIADLDIYGSSINDIISSHGSLTPEPTSSFLLSLGLFTLLQRRTR